MESPHRPILIAGPTASGKSSLALALAERLGGWIINADLMQVYSGWHLLTARPSAEEESRASHRMYGHIDPENWYSVGEWLREITTTLNKASDSGVVPIIVGGSGLNFTALTRGLSTIPPIAPEIRDATNALLERLGADAMRKRLVERDPTAQTLDIINPRRIIRAWEVLEQTGRPLADWMANTPPALLPPENAHLFVVDADRDTLVTRIESRFDTMVAEGILDEVKAMQARALNPELPAMKAVGAPPLLAHLDGKISLEQAITQAKTDTRRYAKRQRTWLRNQMPDWHRIPMGLNAESLLKTITQASCNA